MTTQDFSRLPLLLDRNDVVRALGYSWNTVAKMIDSGILRGVRPAGCHWFRYQKVQVAKLAGLGDTLAYAARQMQDEPLLMGEKSVCNWTGYAPHTLARIVRAGGLTLVKPPGNGTGRYLKLQIADLVGLPA